MSSRLTATTQLITPYFKRLLMLGLICGVYFWGSGLVSIPVVRAVAAPVPAVTTSANTTPVPLPVTAPIVGIPQRLIISAINVNTPIVQEGVTPEGSMDVPNNTVEAGWYKYGSKPGEQGNAVIDGHLAYSSSGGVFANLHNLPLGGQISVVDVNGVEYQFKVNHTELLAYNDTNLNAIFGATTNRQLVIITCAGTWLQAEQTYSQRLIVFAERI